MRGCRNTIRLSGIEVGDASTSYGFCGVGQPLMSITRIGNNSSATAPCATIFWSVDIKESTGVGKVVDREFAAASTITSTDPMRLKCSVRMRGRGGHDLMLGWTAGSVGSKNSTLFAGGKSAGMMQMCGCTRKAGWLPTSCPRAGCELQVCPPTERGHSYAASVAST